MALDADARENADVARAQHELVSALRRGGLDARLWQWPAEAGKGLDDVLLSARERAAGKG